MKYRLSQRQIMRAEPEGFSEGSGETSLYTPTLVTIQLQYLHFTTLRATAHSLSCAHRRT